MKRIFVFMVTVFLLVFAVSFSNTLEVNATVKMNKKTALSGISTSTRTKKHLSGTPDTSVNDGTAYCFDKSKSSPSVGQKADPQTPEKVYSGKRLCALYKGCPSGGCGTTDFLETQIALWMIQAGKTGISISSMPTKDNYIPGAKKIYESCKNADGYRPKPKTNVSLSLTAPKKITSGNYVVTGKVTMTNATAYTITSISGISGLSATKSGNTFTIKIPQAKITKATKITVNVKDTGPEYYMAIYKFKGDQRLGVLLKHTTTDTASKTVTVNPEYFTASVKKVDASNSSKVLSGATFALYKGTGCSGTALKSATTNASGIATFSSLLTGTYSVKETKAPAGYSLNSTCKAATLNGTITQTDPKLLYTASVKKVDEEDQTKVLSGAEFSLYSGAECSGTAIKTATTDSTGIATFNSLESGTYSVKETKAPDGYNLNSTCNKATLNGTITQTDSRILYTASVKKVDAENANKVLPNAKFSIYDNDSCTGSAIDTKVTDSTGIAKFENLAIGDYYVKEIEAPDGYEVSDTCSKATLNDTITLKDTKKDVYVQVKKVDSGDETKVLPNAKFGLYTDSNCSTNPIETLTTGENGEVIFKNLDERDYYVKEIEAPEGYELNDTCNIATVNTTITVKNTKKYGVEIIKIDEKDPDSYLKDAEFSLYSTLDCTGEVIKTAVTDINGVASFPNLEMSTYSIKETKAPEGYKESDVCYTREDGKTITASNIKYKSLAVKKIDSVNDGVLLSGAEFSLYKGATCEGEEIDKGTTDATGIITFTKLVDGTYSVKETKAPEGYKLDSKCLSGEVGDTIIAKNDKYQSISVVKTDNDDQNKFLQGTKFNLYNGLSCAGEVLKSGETDKDGKVTFDELTVGEYSVKEEKAPIGYYDILDINQSCKGVALSGNATFDYKNEKVKCEFYDNKYYDDKGNVVTEDEYNLACNPKCEKKDDKYYNNVGKIVTEDEYNEDCNPKCQLVDGIYYSDKGKPIDYDAYKKACGLRCILKDGKYYNKDYEEVDEAGYKKSCNPNCEMKDDKYYDDDGNEIAEDEYNEKCNPKCGIKDDKYYNNEGKEVEYDKYKSECFPCCGIKDDKYYDDKNNEVSEKEYNLACNPKCTYENGKYFDKNGNPVSEEAYNASCNPKCDTKDEKYYNLKGVEINLIDFYKECNPKCNIVNNIYYNNEGKPVSKETYYKECNPKCEIAGGKYYNSSGEPVSKEEYNRICNPKCKIQNGNYYDRNGNSVSEVEYNKQCNPKCEEKNGVYYGKQGNVVAKSTYENECMGNVAAADTGSPVKIILTILGIALILVPIGMFYKDQIRGFVINQFGNKK